MTDQLLLLLGLGIWALYVSPIPLAVGVAVLVLWPAIDWQDYLRVIAVMLAMSIAARLWRLAYNTK